MRDFNLRTSAALLSLLGIFSATSNAADVDYLKQIKPILASKCYACHGALKQEAGLRLETRELILKGGDSGPAMRPGNLEESLLLERITGDEDTRMPPAGEGASLKATEIALIRSWIQAGAEAPVEPTPEAPSQHWAFQRIERPTLPRNENGEPLAAHPIDAFLQRARDGQSLKVQPHADRSILIRRLYLDLMGLPPTVEQLNDTRHWNEIVDELLKSSHHGERWARHWMDVWRYTDWYGLGAQLRNSQKHIWHWRDWIVESLNDDKGYDRMILEMLAGDELAPNDPDVLRATGFLARNYYLFNRTTWLDSTIEHTGKAFVGLTLNCAKCHDHKYDPITNLDYYRFRAIFEPHQVRLDPIPGVIDLEQDGLPRVFDDQPDAVTFLHRRGDPKNPDKETPIQPGVPEFLNSFQPKITQITLPVDAYAPGVRDYVQQDHLAAAQKRLDDANQKLLSAREELAKAEAKPKPKIEPTAEVKEDKKPFLVETEFTQPEPDVWKVVGNGWKFEDGALKQTQSTRERYFVQLKGPHPDDFELTCRYTHTGGATYKSITFRFDESEDGSFANYVYTSAHAPGPKVQVAYTRKGESSYPPQGRKGREIKVGQAYELRFAVRGNLVNVWLDDEFQVAYNFPGRGSSRLLSFSAFDATASFESIRVRSLPTSVELTSAGNAAPADPKDPAQLVKVAQAAVDAAEAQVLSLEKRTAADNARYRQKLAAEELEPIILEAARAQARARVASAAHELLASGTDAARKTANTKLRAAQQKLSAIDKGAAEYTTIRASRKALETPAHKEPDYPPVYSAQSTGRRLALARWVTSRENPLTARVAVNQVWMRHFGEPLVESVFDFGLRTAKPLHADLLDYLAAEFIDSGWSFRHLHRLMVTSETYQLSSSTLDADSGTLQRDATNKFYWRMNSRRMEAQVVRDCLLKLSGQLDLSVGGPSIDPAKGGARRSLYFKHSRDQQDKFLDMFDDADHLQCYRRTESIVPQQALALSNSKLSLETAEKIAQQVSQTLTVDAGSVGSRDAFIKTAFRLLLGRDPDQGEVAECQEFCEQIAKLRDSENVDQRELRVGTRLVHALLNHNDFISIR